MNVTNLLLDILEAAQKTYARLLRKPHVTVRVQYAPKKDRTGQIMQEMFALTIINESGPAIDIGKAWLLTSFNRPIFSELIESKLPVKIPTQDRCTSFLPMDDLKAVLNKKVKETYLEAVVTDSTGHQYTGRVDVTAQDMFAR